ncbi:MAG: hypothetical protein Q7S20_02105 [Gemmatimonadaceae bacterium]|nr:hypothetical protein [Gemmatimonadaceae bacterium]
MLEKREGADHVRIDEIGRSVDRPVDVRLGGGVDDRVWACRGKQLADAVPVTDVEPMKLTALIFDVGQRFQIAGIGQLVNVDDGVIGVANDHANEGRSDEPPPLVTSTVLKGGSSSRYALCSCGGWRYISSSWNPARKPWDE